MIAALVVVSASAVAVHASQPRRAVSMCSASKNRVPAYSSGIATSRSRTCVTTPRPTLPPRSAQNRSGCSSADASTTSPVPVTTVSDSSRSELNPWLRANGPSPPPSR